MAPYLGGVLARLVLAAIITLSFAFLGYVFGLFVFLALPGSVPLGPVHPAYFMLGGASIGAGSGSYLGWTRFREPRRVVVRVLAVAMLCAALGGWLGLQSAVGLTQGYWNRPQVSRLLAGVTIAANLVPAIYWLRSTWHTKQVL